MIYHSLFHFVTWICRFRFVLGDTKQAQWFIKIHETYSHPEHMSETVVWNNKQSERGQLCMHYLPKLFCHSLRLMCDVQMALTMFFCQQKKNLHPVPAEGHAAARSMKLLAKIPKDAEATVVLVGKQSGASFQRLLFSGPEMMLSHRTRVFQ